MSSDHYQTLMPRKANDLNVTVLPDGRWLLYDQAERSAVTLSASAGILWELCDGETPIASLIEQLRVYYPNIAAGELEAETRQMLDEFVARRLISPDAAHAL